MDKQDLIIQTNCPIAKAILAKDLKRAFDNVTHQVLLTDLNSLNCVSQTYNYVSDFLSNLKAILIVGDLSCGPIDVGGRGTPQGVVVSPFLCNKALVDLPTILGAIPDLHHALYTDDKTLGLARAW